jgi:DNA polymerase
VSRIAGEDSEAQALARAFARHLEHLREFRGVHYVGAAQMQVETDPVGDPVEAHVGVNPAPEQSLLSNSNHSHSPASPNHQGTAGVPAPATPQVSGRAPVPATPQVPGPATPQARGKQWPAARKLAYLRDKNVGDCHRCPLSQTRRNIVFGVGDPEAQIMFVGEAPGADEDRIGEPFVGAAGQRLNRWLEQLGLAREQVYIANVLKCRPPGNRNPHALEIERCAPFLHAQIRAIEPKVIVALGRFAGCLLLGVDMPLHAMRGQPQRYREPKSGVELPVVVTYHPSYVIRTESKPRDARGRAQTDRGGVIKSEDQKVLDDLARAVSLTRSQL